MRDLALAVCALLAFLVPVGCYFFILALINRRGRPLVVRGVWDTVGLLAAGSGFFLATAPMLLTELHLRISGEITTFREFFNAPFRHWLMWLVYILLMASGGVWIFLWRMHKTMIYNVDTEHFSDVFKRTLAGVGLAIRDERQGRLMLAAAPPPPDGDTGIMEHPVRVAATAADASTQAEVEIEYFPAMCHVTLHWDNYTPWAREQIENELQRSLELVAPEENPAAGWFLSLSGIVFGALFMIVVVVFIFVLRL